MNCDKTNEHIKVIDFITNNILASIDIKILHKVVDLPKINPITDGPSHIIGIINFAGIIIPVIDLSIRIQPVIPQRYTLNTPILICNRCNDKKIGLIVDTVCGLSVVDQACIEDYTLGDDKLFAATIKYPSKISLLINVDYAIQQDEFNIKLGNKK